MMNKRLILQLLAVIAFTGTQINAAGIRPPTVPLYFATPKILTPAYFAALTAASAYAATSITAAAYVDSLWDGGKQPTAAAAADATNASNQALTLAANALNAANSAAAAAAGAAKATAATIVNGNVFQTLYIGIVGNPSLAPIAAYVLGAPSPSIQVATPRTYLVYPSNNPNGDALLLTVNSPTSIGVQKCKTINGNLNTSFSLPPMVTYNSKNGIIYICRNSGMDNGTIFTDATQTTAMTIQM